MTPNLPQLLAASALIVTCERVASSGLLSEKEEGELRMLICRACRAFSLPTIAERPANQNANPDQQLSLVAQEMERGDSLC